MKDPTQYNFSKKCDFPIFVSMAFIELSVHRSESYDNLETYDPILERRKIGLYIYFLIECMFFKCLKYLKLPSFRQTEKIDFR